MITKSYTRYGNETGKTELVTDNGNRPAYFFFLDNNKLDIPKTLSENCN